MDSVDRRKNPICENCGEIELTDEEVMKPAHNKPKVCWYCVAQIHIQLNTPPPNPAAYGRPGATVESKTKQKEKDPGGLQVPDAMMQGLTDDEKAKVLSTFKAVKSKSQGKDTIITVTGTTDDVQLTLTLKNVTIHPEYRAEFEKWMTHMLRRMGELLKFGGLFPNTMSEFGQFNPDNFLGGIGGR